MRSREQLFPYQVEAIQAAFDRRQVAIFLEPGYGKTVITLTALQRLRAFPALVVAPALVVRSVWQREAREWAHLANLHVLPLVGSPAQRVNKLMGEDAHVEVVSYENLMWLTETVDVSTRYRAIVFDELSRMKTPGTKRFRRMRASPMDIPVRIGLTGTPVGNHLLDIWGEMYMVAGKKPLGPTFTEFRDKYFVSKDFYQRVWNLMTPDCERQIHEAIRPHTYVLPKQVEVKIPPVVVNRVHLDLPKDAALRVKQLEKDLFTILKSGIQLEALQASTVAMKVRQFSSGAVYYENQPEAKWEEVHSEKIDAAMDIVQELQGEPVIIFYWFKHELIRLKEALRSNGVSNMEVTSKGAIDAWNKRQVEVLLAHPQSAGHGINLQEGGHTVIWYTLPFSHELWKQGNGRVARTGQKAPRVTAHVLMCGAIDEVVGELLIRKGETEARLMEGVK